MGLSRQPQGAFPRNAPFGLIARCRTIARAIRNLPGECDELARPKLAGEIVACVPVNPKLHLAADFLA
jgi:hypothetical protein